MKEQASGSNQNRSKPRCNGLQIICAANLFTLLSIFFLCSASSAAQQPELVMQVGHHEGVRVVGFIQDGRALITKGEGTPGAAIAVKIWDVHSGKLLQSIPAMNPVVLSRDKKTLATSDIDRTIKVWDVKTGRRLGIFRADFQESSPDIESIAFSADGHTLASLNTEQTSFGEKRRSWIQTWEVATGQKSTYPLSNETGSSAIVFTAANKVVPIDGVVSPDRRLIARPITRAQDKELEVADWFVELRELETGKLLRVIKASALDDDLEFSQDSKILGTRSRDSVELWNVSNGNKLGTIKADFSVYTSRFSDDGRLLALGGSKPTGKGAIEIFDVASGALLQTLNQTFMTEYNPINSLAFSPDNKMIASGTLQEFAGTLWDVASGKEVLSFSGYENLGDSVSFSPDGRFLVIPSRETGIDPAATFILWSLVSGGEPRRFAGEFLAFSPDGRTLLVKSELPKKESEKDRASPSSGIGEKSFKLKLLDVGSGAELRTLENTFSGYNILEMSPDGRVLASGPCCLGDLKDVTVNLWNIETGQLVRAIKGFPEQINFITFSPDSSTIAIGSGKEKSFSIWNVATGTLVRQLVSGDYEPSSVEFSPDGKKLASLSGAYTDEGSEGVTKLRVWDVASGNLLYTRDLNTSLVTSIAFSPDSRLLATSSIEVELWEAATGKKLHIFQVDTTGAADSGTTAFFSPDSKLLVSSFSYTNGSRIQIWKVDSGVEVPFFKTQSEDAQSGSFDLDGKRFVTLGRDGMIKLWSVESGQAIASLAVLNHDDWLAVTPDGRFDGTPGAWNRILWRFTDSIFNVAPVEIFFNEFYYPGLLSDVMSGRRVQATRRIDQLDRRQPQLKLTLADGQQAIGPITTRNVTVEVELTEAARDEKNQTSGGAQDARLFRNGSLVKLWRGDAYRLGKEDGCKHSGDGRVTCRVVVPIVNGANQFTAYAFNRDNVKSSDAQLTISGGDNLKRPGVLYVLAVGVGRYENPQYNLNYTAADAQDFAAEVKRQQEKLARYERVDLILLLDLDATKTRILSALRKLAETAEPEDAVVIYFSGHGTAQGDRFYLIPHDIGYMGSRRTVSASDLQTILAHSISDKELEEAVRQIDAGRLLLLIDSCNSGKALQADDWRRGPMNTRGLGQLAWEKGMYIVTASQDVELAYESDVLKHSYLTYALVEEGLKTNIKDADANHDGQVDLREWFDYAMREVPRLRQQKMEQSAKRQGKQLEEVEVTDGGKVQTPRVFYRREPELQPFVVAKVGASK